MYKVNVHCENCGCNERIIVPDGEWVTQTLCSVCGCKTLSLAAMPNPERVEEK